VSAAEGVALALATELRREEVLRFLGYPEGRRPAPGVEAVLGPALDAGRALAEARGIFRRLPVLSAADAGLPPFGDGAPAAGLVLGLVTAGAALEQRSAELARGGRTAEALVLDAAGSAAAEEAADRLCALIVGEGPRAARSERLACRVSPGYGDWPLAAQRLLFDLVPHQAVGVELLPSLMMRPRKSVSFAIWLDGGGRPVPGLADCRHCLLERCAFRREPR
jgi:hypothetical protein